MIPVEQTILKPPLGNCFPACIASVLELPLHLVPHPTAEEGASEAGWREYLVRVQAWLARMNLCLVGVGMCLHWKPAGLALLGAASPRGEYIHSVVCRDGDIVWDPHPERAMGVGEWLDWHVFQMLDPKREWIVHAVSPPANSASVDHLPTNAVVVHTRPPAGYHDWICAKCGGTIPTCCRCPEGAAPWEAIRLNA